jgi:pimeloyl-ACP methyl ester carboxylesterase
MPKKHFFILFFLWSYPSFLVAQNDPITVISSVHETDGITLGIRHIACQPNQRETRTILLIHGGGSIHRTPGAPDTSFTAGSCEEAATDIDAVIDHILQTEHIPKVNLFGWATGGHWAAYYTTLHNDEVDHLIVLNTLYGVNGPWSLTKDFADPTDSNRYNTQIPLYRESPPGDHRVPAQCHTLPKQDRLDRYRQPAILRRIRDQLE